MNQLNISMLRSVSDAKHYFERNGLLIDKELRDAFTSKFNQAVVTSEQHAIIEELIGLIKVGDVRWEHIEEPGQKDKVNIHLSQIHDHKANREWLKVESTIDTSPEEALAWMWDYCGASRMPEGEQLWREPREIVKWIAPNQQIWSSVKVRRNIAEPHEERGDKQNCEEPTMSNPRRAKP